MHLLSSPAYLSFYILAAIFLIPHGIGIRTDYGHVDIPRITIIIVTIFGFFIYIKDLFTARYISLPWTGWGMLIFAMFLMLSALTSSAPWQSALLCSQLLTIWVFFPIAFYRITKSSVTSETLLKQFAIILFLLFCYCLYEVFTQEYAIRPQWRTSFWGIEEYDFINTKRYIREGLLLPQGPYTWNHALAGVVTACFGVVIYLIEKKRFLYLLLAYAIIFLVLSTAVRAALVGCVVAVAFYCAYKKEVGVFVHSIVAFTISFLANKFLFSSSLPVLFVGDMTKKWGDVSTSENVRTLEFYSNTLLSKLGTLGERVAGLYVNLLNIEEWWLFGYGFASFQRPDEIPSNAFHYNDPGLILLFFFESGIMTGLLLILIMGTSFFAGLKFEHTKHLTIGVLAWGVFGLSSWELWPLTIVMIIILFISHREQLECAKMK